MTSSYDIIREACIAANPDIVEMKKRFKLCSVHGVGEDRCHCVIEPRPIRLADVLLAIGKSKRRGEYVMSDDGEFWEVVQGDETASLNRCKVRYDLRKTLEDQSQATQDFIASLIR